MTSTRKIESVLKESKEEYQDLYDNAPDMFCSVDAKTAKILRCNNTLSAALGYSRDEIIGQHISFVYHPDCEEIRRKVFQSFVETGEVRNTELQLKRKDGSKIDVSLNISSVRNEQGKVLFSRSIWRDITERKRMEDALQFTQFAVDNNSDATYWIKSDGRISYVNHAACQALGYTNEELVSMSVSDIDPDFPQQVWPRHWQEMKEAGSMTFEAHHKTKDGRVFPVEILANYLKYNKEEYICAYVRDITERKKVEEVIQKQKKDLEQKNIALSEVLGQVEIEKKQIKDNVITNAENLLLPVIQKLRLKGESRKYVHLLRKNLQELTSSFGAKLTKMEARLTSREIEICNMIKNGLTSKEIASLLNITLRTTEKHRANIRNKLGIINKDLNLTSFLKTL